MAEHLPGVSASAVIAEAVTLQLMMIATLDELGHADDGLNLTAHRLLNAYTEAVIARRLDVSALSTKLARGIEAEIEARAHALAKASQPRVFSSARPSSNT